MGAETAWPHPFARPRRCLFRPSSCCIAPGATADALWDMGQAVGQRGQRDKMRYGADLLGAQACVDWPMSELGSRNKWLEEWLAQGARRAL